MRTPVKLAALAAIAIISACTITQEVEDIPTGVSIDAEELSFTEKAGSQTVTVTSGSKWVVSAMPGWISVQSIDKQRAGMYEWSVSLSASSNEGYYREGLIAFQAGGEAVSLTVSQQGSKGASVEVDLGLPSGLKWAACNLGASSPEGYGDYYAWGETETKTNYTGATYTKYNTKVLEASDDVAHVKLGGSWRMPTDAEWTELRENCSWTWTKRNGVNGAMVTSQKNGASIFLPAVGRQVGTSLNYAGIYGFYWSSSLNTNDMDSAWGLWLYSEGVRRDSHYRYNGLSVRPVTE